MTASSAIAAIGTSVGIEFSVRKVHTAGAAFSRATKDAYIIYKVGFIHAAKLACLLNCWVPDDLPAQLLKKKKELWKSQLLHIMFEI
jgi:hypothetical protein